MLDEYFIIKLCDALEVSCSGYHAARSRPPSERSLADNKEMLRRKTQKNACPLGHSP